MTTTTTTSSLSNLPTTTPVGAPAPTSPAPRSRGRRVALAVGLGLVTAVTAAALVGSPPTSRVPGGEAGRLVAGAGLVAEAGSSRGHEAELEQLVEVPGPLAVQTIVGADWHVDRSGLLDLGDPHAIEAGLVDGTAPIRVFVHTVRHPSEGLFLIDSGVEHAFVDDREHAVVRGLLGSAADVDALRVGTDSRAVLASLGEPVRGVWLTHLHLDHVLGLRDVPSEVPIFMGPGETESRTAMAWLTRSVMDEALGAHPLRTWRFEGDPSGSFDGVLDVFGDGSLFALLLPGHTRGSTAYLARTPEGPVLFAGDVSHTRWGFEHDVAPGTFSEDADRGRASFERLEAFVARHPGIDVRFGHTD